MKPEQKEHLRQRMVAMWADAAQRQRRIAMVNATIARNRMRLSKPKPTAEQATYKLPRIPYAPMPELAEIKRLLEQEG